jgi:hypothetical protein
VYCGSSLWKNGYFVALKLIDTATGYYARIKRNDDITNGTQFIGSYDIGSGETTVFSHTTGPLPPMVSIGIERYAAGATCYARFYYRFVAISTVRGNTSATGASLGAKANFVPDEIRIEFSNNGGPGQSWTIDSYRRIT